MLLKSLNYSAFSFLINPFNSVEDTYQYKLNTNFYRVPVKIHQIIRPFSFGIVVVKWQR